ncbi:hypothetical protein [Haloferax profundi]|uniref:Uncharacterized protein n=1 Tax=Haloferax profundi TaxID=1544718 RepID=A0A0W1RD61_9EURY|nr:hypothetical protein [Haloferax profundi]KTG11346.1 hypothetical protein AUR66_20050 [Haloferax profundi]
MGAGLLFPSLAFAGFVYIFADAIRDAGSFALPPFARGTVAVIWLFGVFVATQRVASARPRIDAEPLILTTVSARTVVGGLFVAETLRVLAYLGLPTLVLTVGSAYLFGSIASILVIPMAAILLAVTAVVVGMVLGYAVALLVATSPFVARHKTVLGGVAAIAAMAVYLLVTLPQVGGIDQAALAWVPIGWLADLAVIGTSVQGSLIRATSIVFGSVAIVVLGGVLVEREATRLWFTDPVSGHEETTLESTGSGTEETTDWLADSIRPLVLPSKIPRPMRRVAQWSVLKTRRDPRRLNFLLLPVVMLGSVFISSGIQSGSLWSLLGPACAAVLPWVAGATFAMNPFGDEGAVLPVTLLSLPGSTYVRGLMIPGIVFGLTLVTLTTGITMFAGSYGPVTVYGIVGVGLLSTLVAVATAPAVGMWFPRFSAISIGQSREVIPPRLFTTGIHFISTTVPAGFLALLVINPELARAVVAGVVGYLPAILLQLIASGDGGLLISGAMWFGDLGTRVQGIDIDLFRRTAGGLLLLGGILVAVLSYQLAVRRFERYSPPM